jgi:glutamate 5-kinase
LLEKRIIPIVNENDTVAVEELQFGDNDSLSALLLNLVEGELLINLTSVQGVYASNPDLGPEAKLLRVIEDIQGLDLEDLCRGKTDSGSGGMYSKLLAARRAAQLGVPTLVLSGRQPLVLEQAFAAKEVGTWIKAQPRAVSRRKFWMAYNLEASGCLVVDAGAALALRDKGKSLLPAGVKQIEGSFEAGDLVRIVDPQGMVLGVGQSNYSSSELDQIKGQPSSTILDILGECPFQEVVHRDNLLLDAAF